MLGLLKEQSGIIFVVSLMKRLLDNSTSKLLSLSHKYKRIPSIHHIARSDQ